MKIFFAILVIVILLPIIILSTCFEGRTKRFNFKELVGVYKIDLTKTKLKGYNGDSLLYEKLILELKGDSTFSFNMEVPFIFDSCGRWTAKGNGMNDWNNIYFKNVKYRSEKTKGGGQFDWADSKDSEIYINATTPQDGKEFIQEIYFRKVGAIPDYHPKAK